jgi:tRNA U34 5-methylaminomethyl-2-thiouridine-forming methyltransferase MnmC
MVCAEAASHTFLITADGSPTLAHPHGEAMHNNQGALRETLHVYGPLADALERGRVEPTAVIVGLGVGYIEALVAARAPALARLVTFEADAHLKRAFLTSLLVAPVSQPMRREIPSGTALHFDDDFDALVDLMRTVRSLVALAHGIEPESLRARLFRWHADGRLDVRGALDEGVLGSAPQGDALDTARANHLGYGGLFFDAYSAKSSAELWTPAILEGLLSHAASRAGVATYAARGSLNRALAARGFRREASPGFGGKRECTLAFR